MDITPQSVGDLLIEGKTKQVFGVRTDPSLVFVRSKDRITAGDGAKSHEMRGKAVLSTQTNCALFEFLQSVGVPTHFVGRVGGASHPDADRSFVAKNCAMIPIEWVARRVATGSYLKRHANVKEGYRFAPLKLETFFKDDANHDPFWSEESLIGARLEANGLLIDAARVKQMLEMTKTVFEVIERVWQTANHALIDMKIEFGVIDGNGKKEIVVADVIDNDSWRLWPEGDKKLMLDKQVYRNLDAKDIDAKAIDVVRANFEVVAQRTQDLFSRVIRRPLPAATPASPEVALVLGSAGDRAHADAIAGALREKWGINDVQIVVSSAHRTTARTLDVLARLQQWPTLRAIVAIAGLSNGLGPVLGGNACVPVINSPPATSLDALSLDIWSSLRMPSGIACSTVVGAENAALAAALVVATHAPWVWSRVRAQQCNTFVKVLLSDSN